MQVTSETHHFASIEDAKQFALAGNATLTLESLKTGVHFTFKVREAKEGNAYFVSLLNGPDNENDFQYLGIIRPNGDQGRNGGTFSSTKASKVGVNAPSFKAFAYFWAQCGEMPTQLVIRHSGRCGRCGRTLTTPESLDSGFGSECRELMGLDL